MYLKKLEIQGFKSFADPVTIEWDEGITCIVGPNGSGKSNISDAMRWVLGEQSAKTLRGGKMDEIIFAGTESRRPKGMAEVTLIIDNSEGILPIDYTEVAIRRRLFKSGESEYYINGSPCRLRDIRELIMDTGIGVDGYSFIGQGRVDKVVSEKPENRREVFEEAAGIIKYKSRKAAAQRKLDSAHQNLESTNIIIEDIESRIGGLQEESEKAKEHKTLSERHRELEINITLKNIEATREKNRELRLQAEEAAAALEKLRGDRAALDAELTALRAQSDELEHKQAEMKDRRAHNIQETLRLRSSAMLNEEKLRGIEKDKQRLESEIAAYDMRIREEEAAVSNISETKRVNDEKLAELQSALETKLETAALKAAELAALTSSIEEKRTNVFDLTREKSLKEQDLSGNEDLLASFDTAKERLTGELDASKKELDETIAEIEAAHARKGGLAAENNTVQAQENETRAAYEASVKKSGEYALGLENMRLSAEQISARKKTIEEMEANYEGFASGVRALMKESLPGIRGVVTDIARVPRGYETAIETALGAQAQHIVCDDRDAAKKAVKFLRENKAGRLTFLPVRGLRLNDKPKAPELENAPGFISYALEKVDFDAEYKDVFTYLLGGVVIADTLDNAVRMSKSGANGYRIVTLDGSVINPAGAITGGAYRNKSANLFERKAEIAQLAEELYAIDKDKEEKTAELAELRAGSERLLAEIRRLDTRGRELARQLAEADGEIKSLEYRRSEIEARIERRERDMRNAAEDKARNIGLCEELKRDIEHIGSAIARLETEAAADLKDQLAAREASEAANEEVTGIRVRVAAAETEKAGSDEAEAQARRRIDMMRTELTAKKEEYEQIAALERGSVSEEDLAQTVRALEQEKEELDRMIDGLEASRNEARAKIEEDGLKLARLADDIDGRTESRTAMEVELGRQETRLQNFKDKLFDEFDLSYAHALEFKKDDFVMSAAVKENREIKSRLLEIGEVNPGSIREYEEVSERYAFLTEQRDDILQSMADYERIVEEMDRVSKQRFGETFDKVAENFDDAFKLLFGGGKGELNLEDPSDPLECGITISVRPPGKANLVSIDSYSGGEKSMIAIALMFAILKAKPTPFCILDEIDAALDEANIQRFAEYVESFRGTQFTLVTHQRSTMEYADALFGVTMQEQGVTTILSLMLGGRETELFAQKLAGEQAAEQ
ncbi:MAG: chromosome segregation protein SMC [Clostridiales Family XIII bacterium]|jgi:chromosome segregation protein|nr:chromosome segregation protein SMC [Clostridiales Family XIII bacterium]